MKAYKGFKNDMTCRDFQYEEGKEYHEERALCCDTGFHACEYPLDCFKYYEPADSVYHEVEQTGDIDKSECDSKVASTEIKIGAKIGIPGLVQAAIEYTSKRCEKKAENHNTGYCGASSNTGDRGASSNTGDWGASSNTGYRGASSNTGNCGASSNTGNRGASSNTGDRGASSNTGDWGASSNTGYCGASSNTGYRGASSNTGNRGASSNTGDWGASSNTGYRGASSNTGNCGASFSTGEESTSYAGCVNSVAAALGLNAKAKGVKGAYIICAEFETDNDGNYRIKGIQLHQVDGEKIKEETYYQLIDGVMTEVD
ncbi:hypothetical protein MUY40_29510 [Blautia sp. NSJ-159]|uniref:DUF7666 domain-containing protein n=1 Tax=unclassified Blautia TaxID=2648079 RepID=UPI001FD28F29|nr:MULTISPECIES: hypothetical protein [unclassified Blautia]MCJ8021072.1 hypothetical protein [Blautia sp. NSJ-159]MCJ8043966.1 hypothetical protein [Blautia sp. NSJ-165]